MRIPSGLRRRLEAEVDLQDCAKFRNPAGNGSGPRCGNSQFFLELSRISRREGCRGAETGIEPVRPLSGKRRILSPESNLSNTRTYVNFRSAIKRTKQAANDVFTCPFFRLRNKFARGCAFSSVPPPPVGTLRLTLDSGSN
jgi:hypothetical protein